MSSRRMLVAAVSLAWLSFWCWAFSFAYSDSFFAYDPWSRVPVFASSVFGAMAVPVSGYVTWRRQRRLLGALAWHACGVAVGLAPLVLTSFVLSRARGRWHLEADDAMGAGIDFGILVGLGLLSAAALLIAWAIRLVVRRRQPARDDG